MFGIEKSEKQEIFSLFWTITCIISLGVKWLNLDKKAYAQPRQVYGVLGLYMYVYLIELKAVCISLSIYHTHYATCQINSLLAGNVSISDCSLNGALCDSSVGFQPQTVWRPLK